MITCVLLATAGLLIAIVAVPLAVLLPLGLVALALAGAALVVAGAAAIVFSPLFMLGLLVWLVWRLARGPAAKAQAAARATMGS